MDINIFWVCLFVFLLTVIVFSFGSIGESKPYWRFGIGFGLVGPPGMMGWLAFITPIVKLWAFPLFLFLGVPIMILGMLLIFGLGILSGIALYGNKRWDKEGQEELNEANTNNNSN